MKISIYCHVPVLVMLAGIMLGLGSTGCRKAETPAPQSNTVPQAKDTRQPVAPAPPEAAALGADVIQLERLKDKDPRVRLKALGILGSRRGEAKIIVLPAVIGSLDDPDVEVRRKAAVLLGDWEEPAEPAVRALIKALDDPDVGLRQTAARSLSVIHADPGVVLPALLRKFDDPDDNMRHQIAYVLGNLGQDAKPAVPALVKALGDKNVMIRNNALSSLEKIDPQALQTALARFPSEQARAKPVRKLLEDLGQPDMIPDPPFPDGATIRKEAAQALRERGTNALPELVRIVSRRKGDRAEAYAPQAFKILGADARPAVPMLIDLFKRSEAVSPAGSCLEAIGQAAESSLIEALSHTNKDIRAGAALTLGDFNPTSQAAVPALLKCMKDENSTVCVNAINALDKISVRGQQLDLIVPVFINVLHEPEFSFWETLVESLGRIAGAGHQVDLIVSELLKALQDPKYYRNRERGRIQIPVAEALARIAEAGQQSDQILPTLLALVLDKAKGPAIRCAVIDALGKPAGQPGQPWPAIKTPEVVKEVLPALLKTIEDPEAKVRVSSVNTLGALGETPGQARAIIPVLLKSTEDTSAEVRAHSIRILVRLEKEPDKVNPILLTALKDQEPMVRLAAAIELGLNGDKTHAKDVRTVCLKIIENPGKGENGLNMAKAAAMILGRLGDQFPEKLRREVIQKIQQYEAEEFKRTQAEHSKRTPPSRPPR